MFESAIEAAETAASAWTPDRGDLGGGRACCTLCLRRYRQVVLTGPLRDLPHAVAHAAMIEVDDIISARVDAELRRFGPAASGTHDEVALNRRARAVAGALTVTALDELAAAADRIADLRRRFTEPAVAAYLGRERLDEVPRQWEG